jgi:hypothetical protein
MLRLITARLQMVETAQIQPPSGQPTVSLHWNLST